MENKEVKNEKSTIEGFISSISEPKKIGETKEVINMSIGLPEKDEEGKQKYLNVGVWFDSSKENQKTSDFKFKKGDNVSVTGIMQEKDNKFTLAAFPNTVKLTELKEKKSNTITLQGTIATDLQTKFVSDNKVTSFSLAFNKEGQVIKEGGEKPKAEFINVSGWENNQKGELNKDLYELGTGKKGDVVELTGYIKPNTYTDKDGNEKTSDNLVVTKYKVISTSLSLNSSQETKDTYLKNSLDRGNFKEVGVALKSGANIEIAKTHDISRHSEKQQKAINDTVTRFELSSSEKKNNSVKI